jgi:hypothetical protein
MSSFSNKSSVSTEAFLTGGQVKTNPYLDSGKPTPVMFETDAYGNVAVLMPSGCPPDMKAYNENRAFQRQRKTKMVAKLRAKLLAKQGSK